MNTNFKNGSLVTAFGLYSMAVLAGSASSLSAKKSVRVIGEAVDKKGVVGCLESAGGVKNLVVNIRDTPDTSNVSWGGPGVKSKRSFSFVRYPDSSKTVVEEKNYTDRARTICNKLKDNGHTHWYLPSKKELNCLYKNKEAINAATDTKDFAMTYYWSSSELYGSVWIQNFDTGEQSVTDKSESNKVRCVRPLRLY